MNHQANASAAGTPPNPVEAIVEDLLLRLELAETEEERAWCQGELDGLVAVDVEAAQVYRMHQRLEWQLRLLALHPDPWREPPVSPVRRWFRRLWARFFPGPVG